MKMNMPSQHATSEILLDILGKILAQSSEQLSLWLTQHTYFLWSRLANWLPCLSWQMGKRQAAARVTVKVRTPPAAVQAVEVVQVGHSFQTHGQ